MRDEEIYVPLGRAIAERRSRIPITQKELAVRVGLSRASIANTERGKQAVSVHNLYAIAAALNVEDPAELLPPMAQRNGLDNLEVKSPHGAVSATNAASLRKLISSISRTEVAKVRK